MTRIHSCYIIVQSKKFEPNTLLIDCNSYWLNLIEQITCKTLAIPVFTRSEGLLPQM